MKRIDLFLILAGVGLTVAGSAGGDSHAGEEAQAKSSTEKATQATTDVPKQSEMPNGFSLEKLSVARSDVIEGGPARDHIRSVDAPGFASVADGQKWVRPDTPVIGVAVGDEARAYPVHLMEHHQIVNDTMGGVPVVVTYDPLTDTAMAFVARLASQRLEFGVSGLVYRSNFLMYDRESESLWSQMQGRAIAGPRAGESLERLLVRTEPMAVWAMRHPDTRVLERPELKVIDYRYSPYAAYWVSPEVPFPVPAADARYHAKELVLGAVVGGTARAYLGSILTDAGGRIVDQIAGRKLRIAYDTDTGTFQWEAPDDVEVTTAYWFAWKAFHPDTEIWRDSVSEPADAEPEGKSEGDG